MTPLEAIIRAEIATTGPMPVSRYMALSLTHPDHGYYVTRDPLGRDFVTSPEIHQIFGELIGGFVAATWEAMGRPNPVHLVEPGPGRGTLMADILRTTRLAEGFLAAARIHLVETSPVLAMIQSDRLAATGVPLAWHRDLHGLPDGPTILITNEFLDALPIRQVVATPKGFRERLVGTVGDRLAFGLSTDPLPPGVVPSGLPEPRLGDVFEICPAIDGLVAGLARTSPLVALIVDYGHLKQGYGDTLQALRTGTAVDPLAAPGDADLTAHVDFEALALSARRSGLVARSALTQRELLFRLGLVARAERLAAIAPKGREALRSAVERLIDPAPTGMGQLFKALAIHTPGLAVPAFD